MDAEKAKKTPDAKIYSRKHRILSMEKGITAENTTAVTGGRSHLRSRRRPLLAGLLETANPNERRQMRRCHFDSFVHRRVVIAPHAERLSGERVEELPLAVQHFQLTALRLGAADVSKQAHRRMSEAFTHGIRERVDRSLAH